MHPMTWRALPHTWLYCAPPAAAAAAAVAASQPSPGHTLSQCGNRRGGVGEKGRGQFILRAGHVRHDRYAHT